MPESLNRAPAPGPHNGRAGRPTAREGLPYLLHLLLHPSVRCALCWLVTLVTAGVVWHDAWVCWDEPERKDGNWGHASIDFGGQWLMGRMIVEGQGRHLYDRNYLRPVLEANYPDDAGKPTTKETDAQNLLVWLMGHDDPQAPETVASFLTPLAAAEPLGGTCLLAAGEQEWTEERLAVVTTPHLGGSLYPPVQAMLFSPLSRMPPRLAYRAVQAATLALAFLAGWVVRRLTEGRVWWPIATFIILVSPGYAGAINLGQNSMLSLALLLVGWWQMARGRPVLAGVLWGFLAFKPVWAAAFLLLTLLTARWRMAAAMSATGAAQILATLPLVGWRTWLDWLEVGRQASRDYARQESWIILSRDLLGVPRRWLLTFQDGIAVNPDRPLPAVLGWGMWAAVVGVTVLLVLWRRRQVRGTAGPAAAFAVLGCYFSCYHFMYYDFLLAAFPICLLFTEPRQYLRAAFCPRRDRPSHPDLLRYYQPTLDDLAPPPVPLIPGGDCWRLVVAPPPPLLLLLILILPTICYLYDQTHHYPPMDTFCLLLLWAWCGYRLVLGPEDGAAKAAPAAAEETRFAGRDGSGPPAQLPQLGANVRRAHEGLADQHGADAGRL